MQLIKLKLKEGMGWKFIEKDFLKYNRLGGLAMSGCKLTLFNKLTKQTK